MIDPADQAQKFQDFSQKLSDDCSSRWGDALQSHVRFQQSISSQWEQTLQDAKQRLSDPAPSESARTMLSLYLSGVAFQREQAQMLIDSQTQWNDMYRQFLDSLVPDPEAKAPHAEPQPKG